MSAEFLGEYADLAPAAPMGLSDAEAANLMSSGLLPSNMQTPAGSAPANAGSTTNYGSAIASLLGAGLGASGLLNSSQPKSGYQGKIPQLTATRQQIPIDSGIARRPGSGGRRYFTDMVYAPKGSGPIGVPALLGPPATAVAPTAPVNTNEMFTAAAQGGMIGYAQGGLADLGYYLGGQTDGMADKIPANIDEKQPAKLSHGEFVISADVVSALGSGNSSAGAKVLYDMMDRVRKHAHGTTKQIKPANLKKVLPA
jgi:hypothetical protein